jgi:hypothetical protein
MLFSTVEEALEACEAAGLEPRDQHGGLGEASYWVCLNGTYSSYWGDRQFLGWANAYFALMEAGGPDEDDTDSEEDVFFVLPSAARGEV